MARFFVLSNGKIVRRQMRILDPLRIPKKAPKQIIKPFKRFKRSKIQIPHVVSMWTNSNSVLVPLECRDSYKMNTKNKFEVNADYFEQLEKALEEAEQKDD